MKMEPPKPPFLEDMVSGLDDVSFLRLVTPRLFSSINTWDFLVSNASNKSSSSYSSSSNSNSSSTVAIRRRSTKVLQLILKEMEELLKKLERLMEQLEPVMKTGNKNLKQRTSVIRLGKKLRSALGVRSGQWKLKKDRDLNEILMLPPATAAAVAAVKVEVVEDEEGFENDANCDVLPKQDKILPHLRRSRPPPKPRITAVEDGNGQPSKSDQDVKCSGCSAGLSSFRTLRGLKRHEKICLAARKKEGREEELVFFGPNERGLFQCEKCGKEFCSKRWAQSHSSKCDGSLSVLPQYRRLPGGEYACAATDPSPCASNQTFSGLHALREHFFREHVPEERRAFRCQHPECAGGEGGGARFASRSQLNRHRRQRHTKPHRCNECGRRFGEADKLRLHLRTHTGERPHACPLCPYRAAKKFNLDLHRKTKHRGQEEEEFDFCCDKCGRPFRTEVALKGHLTTVHGEGGAEGAKVRKKNKVEVQQLQQLQQRQQQQLQQAAPAKSEPLEEIANQYLMDIAASETAHHHPAVSSHPVEMQQQQQQFMQLQQQQQVVQGEDLLSQMLPPSQPQVIQQEHTHPDFGALPQLQSMDLAAQQQQQALEHQMLPSLLPPTTTMAEHTQPSQNISAEQLLSSLAPVPMVALADAQYSINQQQQHTQQQPQHVQEEESLERDVEL